MFFIVFLKGNPFNYFTIENKGALSLTNVNQTVIIYARQLSDNKPLFGLVKYNCSVIPTKYMTTISAGIILHYAPHFKKKTDTL